MRACVGDEVLEWNGYPLQGRTFEEVYDIICESRADHEVEIVVSRPISDVGRPGASINPSGAPPPPPPLSSSQAHGQLPQPQQRGGGSGNNNNNNNNSQRIMGGPSSGGTGGTGPSGGSGAGPTGGHHLSHHQLLQRDRPAVTVTSPGDRSHHHQQSSSSWGKVQVKLWYDSTAQQLSATIVCGYDLPPRPNGAPRNPYAKLFLLPDKRFF